MAMRAWGPFFPVERLGEEAGPRRGLRRVVHPREGRADGRHQLRHVDGLGDHAQGADRGAAAARRLVPRRREEQQGRPGFPREGLGDVEALVARHVDVDDREAGLASTATAGASSPLVATTTSNPARDSPASSAERTTRSSSTIRRRGLACVMGASYCADYARPPGVPGDRLERRSPASRRPRPRHPGRPLLPRRGLDPVRRHDRALSRCSSSARPGPPACCRPRSRSAPSSGSAPRPPSSPFASRWASRTPGSRSSWAAWPSRRRCARSSSGGAPCGSGSGWRARSGTRASPAGRGRGRGCGRGASRRRGRSRPGS